MLPRESGFTLIETMVAAAVAVIFFAGSAVIIQIAIESIGQARARSEAVHLAQAKMEVIRNLPYDHIGTMGGIPSGSILPMEHLSHNGTNYIINTTVVYIDDPYDNLTPTDLLPADYKRIKVSISSPGNTFLKQPVALLTDITSKGLETNPGTGVLSVLVFDASGKPLSNAIVRIEASSVSPAVALDAISDSQGKVILPGTPICNACYHVSVTKNGYTSDRTYGIDEVANPVKPHVSVLEGKVSEVSFAIDVPSSLAIRTTRNQNSNYSAFSGVQMILKGSKEIGRTIDGDPVYKVNQAVVSGSGGMITVPNLEWDSYTVSIPPTSSVDFAGSWPLNPIPLNPGENLSYNLVVDAASSNSLLIQVLNQSQQPLNAATATISNSSLTATQSAGLPQQGDWSQMFFKNLETGSYALNLTAEGYEPITTNITITGDSKEFFIVSTASAVPAP